MRPLLLLVYKYTFFFSFLFLISDQKPITRPPQHVVQPAQSSNSSLIWSKLESSPRAASIYKEHLNRVDHDYRIPYLKGVGVNEKVNDARQLIKDCESYTRKAALNDNLTCSEGVLAQSGAAYLRSILPPTNDVEGYAKLRILDSFSLTNGKWACPYTEIADGRHFFPLDFLKLRVIAEGVLDVFEKTHSGQKQDMYEKESDEPQYQFLVSEQRTRELAQTREIGNDFYDLIKKAFKNKHLIFAGDSTTCCTRHHFVAYLLAMNSPADQSIRQQLQRKGQEGLKGQNISAKSLTSEQAFNILKNGCPREVKKRAKPFVGNRCSYLGITHCFQGKGCLSNSVMDDNIATSVLQSVHMGNSGALSALVPDPKQHFTMLELLKLEAVKDLQMVAHSPSGLPSTSANNTSQEKRKKVLIVHGALHYLNIFPVRPFYELNGINLGHYRENMITLLNTLRNHLGPDHLVIWATAGGVCDAKLEGVYGKVLTKLKEGLAVEQTVNGEEREVR